MAIELLGRVVTDRGEKVEIPFEVHDCPQCGMLYGLTAAFVRRRREDGERWVCPAGHGISFQPSDLAKANARAETAERNAQFWKEQEKAAQKELIAKKGQLTKLKKRIANGVCPCCHRTFQNLARH